MYLENEIKVIQKMTTSDAQMQQHILDIFIGNYHDFYKNIKPLVKKLENILQETEEILKKTFEYYGEKYRTGNIVGFFKIITDFIKDVENNDIYKSHISDFLSKKLTN